MLASGLIKNKTISDLRLAMYFQERNYCLLGKRKMRETQHNKRKGPDGKTRNRKVQRIAQSMGG